MVEIKFVKTDDRAKLPKRNHDNIDPIDCVSRWVFQNTTCDTCYDIYGIEEVIIPAKGSAIVPTGIKVGYITPGFWFKIESRSGLSFKHGILAHPGVIDNQYRGDTGVKMYNMSDKDYVVEPGERIAQIAVYPLIDFDVDWIDSAVESERGDKGFGSSGKI